MALQALFLNCPFKKSQEVSYTNRTVRYKAHNLAYFAKLLKENPIPTNLRQLEKT